MNDHTVNTAPEPASGSGGSSKWLKLGLAVLIIAVLLVAGRLFNLQDRLKEALDWIAGLGAWGWVVFAGLYVVATVLFLPGFILTLGAGFVFGMVKGSILVSISATLGATAAFLVGRHLARDWVSKKIEGNEKFKTLDEVVGREGWKIILLTRLSPIFPFNLLNYAFGLTRVRFWHYFLASWIGMLPGTVMYVYIGSLAGSLATLGEGERERTAGEWALYGVGLLATIAVTAYVTRLARRALKKRIED